jgi:hypothetical protein
MVGDGMSFVNVGTCPGVLSCLKGGGDDEGICIIFLTVFHRD